ncbi:hypothetical protein BU17DRAFT_63732 [Hysterangium stoloniferum]|nr:hypothetical protein BU17DRAFT_63732 [Hysterangium stoloniferum]
MDTEQPGSMSPLNIKKPLLSDIKFDRVSMIWNRVKGQYTAYSMQLKLSPSPYVTMVAKEVMKDKRNVAWDAKPIKFAPFELLAFLPKFKIHLNELHKDTKETSDPSVIRHLEPFISFLQRESRSDLDDLVPKIPKPHHIPTSVGIVYFQNEEQPETIGELDVFDILGVNSKWEWGRLTTYALRGFATDLISYNIALSSSGWRRLLPTWLQGVLVKPGRILFVVPNEVLPFIPIRSEIDYRKKNWNVNLNIEGIITSYNRNLVTSKTYTSIWNY